MGCTGIKTALWSLVWLAAVAAVASADPTWPSPSDELEEIVFQLHGFRARLFADTIVPCSTEASGPGRQNAAEWLRAAFHDMVPTEADCSASRGHLAWLTGTSAVNEEQI